MRFLGRRSGPEWRVRRTEIGGIPCFWAPGPPPFAAALVFRVGRADEQLHLGGITHLAEHLLMPASPPRDVDRNARVETILAVFWASGREQRVLRFLEETAAAVAAPPLHRIETERKILETEAAGGSSGPVGAAMALRYGAQGHGLPGYDELGLEWLGPDVVDAWIGERFSAGNAALWLTGAPPRDLELALPPGSRLQAPEPDPIGDIVFPTLYDAGAPGAVAASFQGTRSPALAMGFSIVVDRIWQELRYELGLAYQIGDWYEPLTATSTHGTLWVECLEQNTQAVASRLLGILEDMAERGPTDEELAVQVERFAEQFAEPELLPGGLHFAATEDLLGCPFLSEEEQLRRRRELTAESVAAAARDALETMLVAVPLGTSVRNDRLHPYPMTTIGRIEGETYRLSGLHLTRAARTARLIVGDEGVTVVFLDGESTTIRFDQAVALQRWPDGSRILWDRDGFRVFVDPDGWRRGKAAAAAIDARVPSELVVDMEPALGRRLASVEEVAEAKLKRRWVVTEELEALPGELRDDERLLTMSEANRGFRPGLLVITDRRLLWLYRGATNERWLDFALDEVDSIRRKRGLMEVRLLLEARGEKIELSDIVPRARAAEIVELLAASRTSPASE
jgi:hypothetical protein